VDSLKFSGARALAAQKRELYGPALTDSAETRYPTALCGKTPLAARAYRGRRSIRSMPGRHQRARFA
jgi:hypothetical protein